MRILMTTGGSLHSETALWFGGEIATLTQEPPTILTVIENEDARAHADKVLARATRIIAKIAPEVKTKVRVGKPETEILAEATEGGYDLLIIGERQLHSLRTKLLGSVPKRILQKAPCALLIAKGQIESIRRMLICDSGASEQAALLSLVKGPLAVLLRNNIQVTVLHVMSQISAGPGVQGTQLRADAEQLITAQAPEGEWLARDSHLLEEWGIHPETKIRHGFVVDEILAEANGEGYDLVVLGTNAAEGWSHYLLEDITSKVVQSLDRPVLVMR